MHETHHLLVVEDSVDDAELMLYALRDAPFKYTAVRVETEFEYNAALASVLPDIVLCDYNLPQFSTARALEILRERKLDIPLIIVSHQIGELAAVAAMQNGASDYLFKSRLGRLPAAISAAIERRILRRQQLAAEVALRNSETMKRGILDSLTTRIAVLDGSGVIVATNKAWDNFAATHTLFYQEPASVGDSYFELLQKASARGEKFAARGIALARAVLNRESNFASIEYEHAEPGGMRWYTARAMPLDDSESGAVISHEDITDRVMAHRALSSANERLQAMSNRLLTVQEDERRGLARELHDDVGQSLAALKIGLHRLAQRVGDENREILDQCLSTADSTIEKLRNLSHELRPPQLDQLGLDDALNWLVNRHCTTTGLKVYFASSGLNGRLPFDLESGCYRIAQEALNNATRHAKANKIQIHVEVGEGLLKLSILDDGVGFDMEKARTSALKTGSLGLISMQERAELAGGILEMRTSPGAGTTVYATFPIGGRDTRPARNSEQSEGEEN